MRFGLSLRGVKAMLALTIPKFFRHCEVRSNPVDRLGWAGLPRFARHDGLRAPKNGGPGATCPWLPAAALTILLLITGCAYRPLYGEGSADKPGVAAQLGKIRIQPVAERSGQKLRNLLIDRIYQGGVPEQPEWQLQITLQESKFNNDIDRADTATRTQLIVNAQADLIATGDGKIVWSRNNRVIAPYNVLISPFGTLINEDDARGRALNDLADDITAQLGLFFAKP